MTFATYILLIPLSVAYPTYIALGQTAPGGESSANGAQHDSVNERIRHAIQLLRDRNPALRTGAANELIDRGVTSVPELLKYSDIKDGPLRIQINHVLGKIEKEILKGLRADRAEIILGSDGRATQLSFGAFHSRETLRRCLPLITGLTHLESLNLTDCLVLDDDLTLIGEGCSIHRLVLRNTRITDRAIVHLQPFVKKIRYLDLSGTDVTDDGLKLLNKFRNLESIELTRTGVTGKSIASLKELKRLVHLSLNWSKITDDNLANVATLHGLTNLELRGTEITDEGIYHLANCSRLQHLTLAETKTTDQALRHISSLPLLSLWLFDTGITDAGLDSLARINTLTQLHLGSTQVTAEGVLKLKGMPNIAVLNLPSTITKGDVAKLRDAFGAIEDENPLITN